MKEAVSLFVIFQVQQYHPEIFSVEKTLWVVLFDLSAFSVIIMTDL